ncbi:hypothetical protein [uncultured Corynebacterium sp.]|uniref:hypothetical protein n=1 Tax=uncultured Corynebacterium sp. TaxID=159447 RepID=UPI002595E114|nr:hypothetical protein [uncultured Corynebacterium sp.]
MTIVYVSWAVMFIAWLVQFVAWRREAVRREQLELQVCALRAQLSIGRHPAMRGKALPQWIQEVGEKNG